MPRLPLRLLLLIVLPLTAYSFMLPAPFKTMDDQVSIVANPTIRHAANLPKLFTQGYFRDNSYYRPLANVTYMGEFHAFGLTPFFYNLDNLLLHIAIGFLVWTLAIFLTGNATAGFLVAVLFAIHPIHWEAVANISGRPILLCTFFGLLSFLFFYQSQLRRHWGWLVASLIAFAAALCSKESAAILPGVFFLYLVFLRRVKWNELFILFPFAVLLCMYLLLRQHIGITQIYHWRNPIEYGLGFLTFLRSLITDLRLFVLPTDLHFDRCLPLLTNFFQAPAMMTLFFWLVALSWLLVSRKRINALTWFCLGWFALEIFPVSQIIATIGVGVGYISAAEHFFYMASVPLFILMVLGGMRIYQIIIVKNIISPIIFKLLVGIFFVFLFGVNIEQNIYASSELAMLERSLRLQPYNARVNFSAGMVYVQALKFKEAEDYFRAAVMYDPSNSRFHIALGQCLCDQGRLEECLDMYNNIKDPRPFEDMLNTNRRKAEALLEKKKNAELF